MNLFYWLLYNAIIILFLLILVNILDIIDDYKYLGDSLERVVKNRKKDIQMEIIALIVIISLLIIYKQLEL